MGKRIFGQSVAQSDCPTTSPTALSVKASLDLSTVTVDDDTVVQAMFSGARGNNITIQFVPGDALAYDETISQTSEVNGSYARFVTITYVDGVTTVGEVETIIGSDASFISVKTTGTSANVLHDPGDTFGPTNLAGGVTPGIDMTLFLEASRPRWWHITVEITVDPATVSVWGLSAAGAPADEPAEQIWGLHQDEYGTFKLGVIGTLLPTGVYHFITDGLGVYSAVYFQASAGTVNVTLSEILDAERGN